MEKHNAFEFLTDEEQDPVLMWDEYCRRGEEQRQQAEKIMGWTMSFQEVSEVYKHNIKRLWLLRLARSLIIIAELFSPKTMHLSNNGHDFLILLCHSGY